MDATIVGVNAERGEGRTCTASFMVIGAFAGDAMIEAPRLVLR